MIINQILSAFGFFYYQHESFLPLNFLNFVVLHGLIWLPLILRYIIFIQDLYFFNKTIIIYRLWNFFCTIRYNYYHVNNKLREKDVIDDYNKFFNNQFELKIYMHSVIRLLLPYLIFIIIVFLLIVIKESRCSLFYWIDRIHIQHQSNKETNSFIMDCGIPDKKYNTTDSSNSTYDETSEFNSETCFKRFVYADIIKNFINFLEIYTYIIIFTLLKRYPWKRDYFLFYREYLLVLIIWLFFNDLIPLLYSVNILAYSGFLDYLNNLFRIFSLLIVFTYLNITRKKMRLTNINLLIVNFNNFIAFPPFYKYFQDYLTNNYENEIKYLDFWINYNILDNKIYRKKKMIENREINHEMIGEINKEIHEKILEMYKKYYGFSHYNTSIISEKTSRSEYRIEFPIDMQEKVEEIINKLNDQTNPEELFEESFNFVYHHLSNIYSDLVIKDRRKLENILFLVKFFELEEDEEASSILI